MPFSLGKRSCVAESFVKKWLFIYIVAILQNFSISSASGEEAFDEVFHLTIRPKKDVQLTFQLRNES
ncbi:cytochrome P450-like protein [Euroglyphus maynei]|uniref:Cytochrome P450-like protein n=1 Tax=Euroglyphus maynei TaxID=6958 RepID=A0A1Y3BDL5_EURMA|nr:cytochrome P450-like protein [Euroglyphus maynei]